MSTIHIIDDIQEETNSCAQNNSTIVQHQIKKKSIRTVGNFSSNGTPITTTATASSAKCSVTSDDEGKSVVSSVSLSLERKESIQYMPQKISPCIIPAGQSTVIHLDNYNHFMAQRVTTTKTSFTSAGIISKTRNQSIVPSSTITACRNSSSSKGVGFDVDLKVVLGGSYRSNNKISMNKQKMLDSKAGSSKVRGRNKSIALDFWKPEAKKSVDIKVVQDEQAVTLKSILTKPKPNRRKKVLKPRQTRKSKTQIKSENVTKPEKMNENTETQIEEIPQISPHVTQPESDKKILRPCIYTLQNKKCLNEMTCRYLHSDFPCKYYYLSLLCPQGVKCRFMHNGPLEQELLSALGQHILELLTIKPFVEKHFIKQLHNIEDLTERLQSFKKIEEQQNQNVVIEVLDDDDDNGDDQDHVLVINESGDDANTNDNLLDTTTSQSMSNPMYSSQSTASLTQPTDALDILYQNVKETNTIIDEMHHKLKHLKTASNLPPQEKIHQLHNIYKLLKEQEKRLPAYEHINATSTEEIPTQTNVSNEQPHIVLVNPEIVNEIEISESPENVMSLTEEDSECLKATNLNIVPEESTMEIIADEKYPQENGIVILADETLPLIDDSDMITLTQVNEMNNINVLTNMDYEEESTANVETILNSNSTNKDNDKNYNTYSEFNNKLNDVETMEYNKELTLDLLEDDIQGISKAISVNGNSPIVLNETEIQEENLELGNTLPILNETLELGLTVEEKEVIERHMEAEKTNEEIDEEESPSYEQITKKPIKKSHVRLRSHTQQDNKEAPKNNTGEKLTTTSTEPIKPIKSRRLRLPKLSQKSVEKTNDESQNYAEIINKLIKSTEKSESQENSTKVSTLLKDVEAPLTQNVILSKRFIKRAKKAKLEQQSPNKQTIETTNNSDIQTNVEKNMHNLHSEITETTNTIENIIENLLTQTSDDYNLLNRSQDPIGVENSSDDMTNLNNDQIISKTTNESTKTLNKRKVKSSYKSPTNIQSCETAIKTFKNRRISFENPTSSSASSLKEQFNLGNPHVVLTKLKSPYLLTTIQNDMQADSTTTTNVNQIVTSSSFTPLADNCKTTQKRHNFSSECDLDSTLNESNSLKIDDNKPVRKVSFENVKCTYSGQSYTSKEEDSDSDSADEKLTIVAELQTTPSSSSSVSNEQKHVVEPFTTHVVTTHHRNAAAVVTTAAHHHVHKEQQENESDLRQQIENVSNKSDLQLHIQQQQQQNIVKEITATTTTTAIATISITKNSNNLPHKQHHQQQEQNMVVLQQQQQQQQKQQQPDNKKDLLLQPQQYENNFKEKSEQIANACKPYGNNKDRQMQSSTSYERIDDDDEPKSSTSISSDKYSNETLSLEKKENIEYSTTYSSLCNKLTSHSAKCQINSENSTVNITPISSPTYADDTIASPSPVRRSIDFHMGGEIDGRLTYPPMPYILHEIDLLKLDVNKPPFIDQLKKTIQLDPRIFRTHNKKQLMTSRKPSMAKTSNALVPLTTYNSSNLSTYAGISPYAQPTSSTTIISPYDPRNHTPAVMPDITTPPMAHHTAALFPYMNINNPTTSSSFMHTEMPNTMPLALQYHSTTQPSIQPQQQQTPNMFLYGCLQRSPWYQSLMSTMKIQINQSISQLVRALNSFHRECLLNPQLVFDVFKIDCAGELLEIMRNLGIFVDANGIIHEQRDMPTFAGRSSSNTIPVNATYSFIQQVLTPNTHCTSMATASSSYNNTAAGGGVASVVGPHEPFVSCYIKAPEPPQHNHSGDCCSSHNLRQDNISHCKCNCNNNCNKNYNNNDNNSCCNNNNDSSYNQNTNNRRFGGNQFKKPYDNYNSNNNGNNNNYRSNSRSSYNSNPRFSKPGSSSPNRTSPPNSPRGGFGGSGNSYGGGASRGRFNNNRRFNNFNNNDKYNSGSDSSTWSSSLDSNKNHYNKFGNNSPTRTTTPNPFESSSPSAAASKTTLSSPENKSATAAKSNSTDEECWD